MFSLCLHSTFPLGQVGSENVLFHVLCNHDYFLSSYYVMVKHVIYSMLLQLMSLKHTHEYAALWAAYFISSTSLHPALPYTFIQCTVYYTSNGDLQIISCDTENTQYFSTKE